MNAIVTLNHQNVPFIRYVPDFKILCITNRNYSFFVFRNITKIPVAVYVQIKMKKMSAITSMKQRFGLKNLVSVFVSLNFTDNVPLDTSLTIQIHVSK